VFPDAACLGSEDIQCYDAFSMNAPTSSNDNDSSDNGGHSTMFVVILSVSICVGSLIIGAVVVHLVNWMSRIKEARKTSTDLFLHEDNGKSECSRMGGGNYIADGGGQNVAVNEMLLG